MSDALSDIARDQRRGQRYMSYLDTIRVFLAKPTKKNRQAVSKVALNTDQVQRGYFSDRTSLAEQVDVLLSGLKSGDKRIWAKFLFSLRDNWEFQKFKKLSPFTGQLLISVDYGCGFVNFHGDLEHFIADIIAKGKGWKTYDADDYVVVLPMPNTKRAKVFWIRCGISGPGIPIDHPRSSNAPSTPVGNTEE